MIGKCLKKFSWNQFHEIFVKLISRKNCILYSEPKHFGWSLWSASIPVEKDAKSVEVWCKAVDSNYNSQPESFKNIWNLRGINNNAYHRVVVNE